MTEGDSGWATSSARPLCLSGVLGRKGGRTGQAAGRRTLRWSKESEVEKIDTKKEKRRSERSIGSRKKRFLVLLAR